jgi:hypothetical protein
MPCEAGQTIESSNLKLLQRAHKHYRSAQDLPEIKNLKNEQQNLAENARTQDSVQTSALKMHKSPFIRSSNDLAARQAKEKNLVHGGRCSISPLAPAL